VPLGGLRRETDAARRLASYARLMAEAQRLDLPSPDGARPIPPVVIDIALAIVVTAGIAVATAARVEPEALEPDVWAYLFAVGIGALMLVRRRWPAGVLIATTGLLFAYYMIGYPAVGVSVPIAGAAYSAAEQGRLRLAIAVSGLVLIVATLYRLTEEPAAKLIGFEGAQNLVLLIAVIALGDSIRARREVRRQTRLRAKQTRLEHEANARALVEQERLRIAREVHDVIAHSVSAISIQSVVGLEALPDEPDNAATALRNIRQVSGTALADLRSAVGVLRDPAGTAAAVGLATTDDTPATPVPTECVPTGIARADLLPGDLLPVAGLADLDRLVATAANSGLQVTVIPVDAAAAMGEPGRRVPAAVDATAHRIVQESITNVLRHSASDRAVVEVHYRPTEIQLRISNTASRQLARAATGLPAAGSGGAATGGFGIAGMRERVELLGGTLTAASTGDGGFRVDAVLPFPAS